MFIETNEKKILFFFFINFQHVDIFHHLKMLV